MQQPILDQLTVEDLAGFVAGIAAEHALYFHKKGYDNACFFKENGELSDAERVTAKTRKKFIAIDIGRSGAYLVEKATGELFNIKAYGVPDYNKKKKSDLGNIASADPVRVYRLRWNYLR